MSTLPSDNFPQVSPWIWTEQRSQAAIKIASGYTWQAAADEVGVDKRTITNWMQRNEFAEEVDRLSLMVDVASRAERLRIAMRVVRQKVREDGAIDTDKDTLDWLKFVQSETDGIKLDLTKLAAAVSQEETPMADPGSDSGTDRDPSPATERVN